MTREEHFLSLVHPECRNIAEDFINDKIDAMFAEYDHCRIEIFENDPDTPSKIINFNDSKHMTIADKFMICGIVG